MTQKIDASLFEKSSQAEKARCPDCGSALLFKQGKHGAFRACENYPSCVYVASSGQTDGHIVKSLSLPCPICAGELVLRQGRFGMFIGCSAYPDCRHIEKPQHNQPQDSEHPACPSCQQGQIEARQSRFGKTFYACNAYPQCQFAMNLPPVVGQCQICGFGLLQQKKKANETGLCCADKKCGAWQASKAD